MAENSGIEWTTHTFNPWRGCTKVSAGCAHCYAETLSGRNPKTLGVWGPSGTRVVLAESGWRDPLRWNKAAEQAGERHRVFCASLADVFEQWDGPMVNAKGERLSVGPHGEWLGISAESQDALVRGELQQTESGWLTMDALRERLFDLIGETPHLDWLILTKRPRHMREWLTGQRVLGENVGNPHAQVWPFANVWIGTSVENRDAAKERIPELLSIPAAVRFLSCEPLLGPLDIADYLHLYHGHPPKPWPHGRVDWVIVGGESGSDARPMAVEWARSLVAQCKAAGVACFVKQLGQNVRATDPRHADWPAHVGFAAGDLPAGAQVIGLKDRKGGDMTEWPADLRLREFPRAPGA